MSRYSSVAKFACVSVLALTLGACSMFQGRETPGQYVDDTTITSKVKEAFIADKRVHATEVNVETMQGVVQLSGFVDSTMTEQRAVQIAQGVSGVKSVKDNITVRGN